MSIGNSNSSQVAHVVPELCEVTDISKRKFFGDMARERPCDSSQVKQRSEISAKGRPTCPQPTRSFWTGLEGLHAA